MNTFFFYTHYYILVMFFISSVATGMIFSKNRNKENAFIFFAFVIYTFTLSMNTFFGYSATLDVENNITSEKEGLLSLSATQALEIVATLLLSIGFVGKAHALISET
ncbi:MAG: hypothetical protein KZQ75_10185 [Candidatus Thiodiazotropha sp. (ex Myrtea spinifera)]|nr:hypothetical protein [Candidatus Thiodiazotropha sp. (ex Myrtea spinifera)]MCU7828127.1 hypothetical protein [Candidatus Thiodiazotropha sp. (ex Myrtea sp. 'scaly one' KF741663)]